MRNMRTSLSRAVIWLCLINFVFIQEHNQQFLRAEVQSMIRVHQHFLKEDTACEYCFSDPLAEEILWGVYCYCGSEDL